MSGRRQLAVDALCPVISLEHIFTGPGTGTHTKWQDELFLLNAILTRVYLEMVAFASRSILRCCEYNNDIHRCRQYGDIPFQKICARQIWWDGPIQIKNFIYALLLWENMSRRGLTQAPRTYMQLILDSWKWARTNPWILRRWDRTSTHLLMNCSMGFLRPKSSWVQSGIVAVSY